MAATYTLPPLSDVMASALGSGAGGPPDAAAQIRSVLTGPPQDMTSPEAKPWIDAMNPKPEFDHRAVDVTGPPDAGGSLTADGKDTVPLLQRSLDQLNISAARLRSAQGMIGFHEADLAKAKNVFAASQARLRNGVRGPEAEDALWNYNYNKADVASRQGELDWANHQLREAQAKHDDHQAWHDSMFKNMKPVPDTQTAVSTSNGSVGPSSYLSNTVASKGVSFAVNTPDFPGDQPPPVLSPPAAIGPGETPPEGPSAGEDSSAPGADRSAPPSGAPGPVDATVPGVQPGPRESDAQALPQAGASSAAQASAVELSDHPNAIQRLGQKIGSLFHGSTEAGTPPSAATPGPVAQDKGDIADSRAAMGRKIVKSEARRDANGNLRVYMLPATDGGGKYEIAGINEKYDTQEAARLKELVEAGKADAAEQEAGDYIAKQTDAVRGWSANRGVEFYLRDTCFNRGATGAATILQMALGEERPDGVIAAKTKEAIAKAEKDPDKFLQDLRRAREQYEDEHYPARPEFRKGLINRWNDSLDFARSLNHH